MKHRADDERGDGKEWSVLEDVSGTKELWFGAMPGGGGGGFVIPGGGLE